MIGPKKLSDVSDLSVFIFQHFSHHVVEITLEWEENKPIMIAVCRRCPAVISIEVEDKS